MECLERGYELGADASEMLLVGDERPQQLCEKALIILKICQGQLSRLETQGLLSLLGSVEVPLVKVLAKMEREGVRVDVDLLDWTEGMSSLDFGTNDAALDWDVEAFDCSNKAHVG